MDRRTFSLQSQHVLFYSFLLFLSPTSNGVSQSTSSNVAHPACALKESICLPISPRFTPTSLLLRGRFSTPPPRPMPELFRIFFPSHPDFRHFFTKNSWFSVSSSPATPNLDVFPVSITQFSPKISCFSVRINKATPKFRRVLHRKSVVFLIYLPSDPKFRRVISQKLVVFCMLPQ